jgi:hypothetical protein
MSGRSVIATPKLSNVVGFRDAKYTDPCCEVSKTRNDGPFARWFYKHHHWLNDAPPQRTALGALLDSVKPVQLTAEQFADKVSSANYE